ncbi:MAG: chemotaxis protein CheB [Armatimonadetes bacterium]|nr:chemotaxis protein CheB [Armatimonadota bacterium]
MQLVKTITAGTEGKIIAPRAVVIIGASTGGPTALAQILPKFPKCFQAAVIVVQQMRPGFTKLLAGQLDYLSELPVGEAERNQPLQAGVALFAPGDYSIVVQRSCGAPDQQFILELQDAGDSVEKMRKRIDCAMTTAAEVFGSRTIGVLLSGVGEDGRDGMKAIHDHGGKTIAQDESSSIVFDMPRAAIDAGTVDEVLPLWNIADRINEIVGEA